MMGKTEAKKMPKDVLFSKGMELQQAPNKSSNDGNYFIATVAIGKDNVAELWIHKDAIDALAEQ